MSEYSIGWEYMTNEYTERSQRLGALLRSTRIQKRVSVSKCAAALGTTRRRYSAIEAGETMIGAIELEMVCDFLGLSLLTVFPQSTPTRIHRIAISPGDRVEIFIHTDSGGKL